MSTFPPALYCYVSYSPLLCTAIYRTSPLLCTAMYRTPPCFVLLCIVLPLALYCYVSYLKIFYPIRRSFSPPLRKLFKTYFLLYNDVIIEDLMLIVTIKIKWTLCLVDLLLLPTNQILTNNVDQILKLLLL